MVFQEQTIGERCKELGVYNYDTALPQDWADTFCAITGLYPPGHFVWSYDEPYRIMGQPVPLTVQAVDALIKSAEGHCTCKFSPCSERPLIHPAQKCGYCLRNCPNVSNRADTERSIKALKTLLPGWGAWYDREEAK